MDIERQLLINKWYGILLNARKISKEEYNKEYESMKNELTSAECETVLAYLY